ncbi:hypothetical protein [Longimicrobium sp.]|uniref:hypothetical protein n=1 Tax=Longimicrobium sp. TaxID=2029185 RepID=UPI002C530122|nr:hypothetical protein [Longimicrobium sp.]HSU16276.1 hypothetical protein [Longimicrobium sp.]
MIQMLRSRFTAVLAAAGLVAASASCAETFIPRLEPGSALFEVEYTNAAWGRRWNGFYVDAQDRVYSYDLGDARFDLEGSGDEFTAAELAAKYAHDAKLVTTLAPGEALARYDGVRAVLTTPLTAPRGMCADAGTLRFSALVYDARTDTYHRVLLHQSGDVAQANLSPVALNLYHWLSGVTGTSSGACDPFDA